MGSNPIVASFYLISQVREFPPEAATPLFRYNSVMNIPFETLLIIVSSLLLLCVLISKVSDRFGIPLLLLFLGIGMVILVLGSIDKSAIDEKLPSLYNHSINFIRVRSKGVGCSSPVRERGQWLKASSVQGYRSHLIILAEEIRWLRN